MNTTSEKIEEEVKKNYSYFKDNFTELHKKYKNKFLVLRNKEVRKYFETGEEAILWAMKEYPDEMFSIQKVSNEVVDLGSISAYAIL